MNRKVFFNHVRAFYPSRAIPQTAVDALNLILDAAATLPVSHAAYIMATAYHEVGPALKPKRENMNYTDAARIRKVWPSRFKSAAEAAPYVRQPKKLANKVYGGRLGNTGPDDGWLYRGDGLVQLTGKANFEKFGVTPPMSLTAAVHVLVAGMTAGSFTGKKLADYSLPKDYRAARAVVNADVTANGDKIAGYARQFEGALRAAVAASPEPAPKPKPKDEPAKDDVVSPEVPVSRPVFGAGLLAIAVALFYNGWAKVQALPCDWLGVFCGN